MVQTRSQARANNLWTKLKRKLKGPIRKYFLQKAANASYVENGKHYWGKRDGFAQNVRLPKGRDDKIQRRLRGCRDAQWVPGYWRCKGNSVPLGNAIL